MIQNPAVSNRPLTLAAPERAKYVLALLSEAACVMSLVLFARKKMMFQALVALASVLLVAMPYLLERYSGYSMAMPLFLFVQFYSLGALLGDGYNWYYYISWWDKLMHTSAGVVFAVAGYVIVSLADKNKTMNPLMAAAFALCFSVTVSVFWEFFEFFLDSFFATDMQGDTYISSINSYILGTEVGGVGSIGSIESVEINGVLMDGYIDIGLIDTMLDMMVETLGAVVLVAATLIKKSTDSLFRKRDLVEA